MTTSEEQLILGKVKELILRTEMVVFLDETGDVIGGLGKKETEKGRELLSLTPCDNCFNGEKQLHQLTSIALAKVTSSPGYFIVCGKKLCYIPG